MLQFAVFGDPISHSLSPQIHQAFAKQFDIALSYGRIQTPSNTLEDALANFRKQGGIGANITVPLKQEAYGLCQHLSLSANESQAVNTIGWNANGELWGDNTDGKGLVQDLVHNHHLNLSHKRILLLGAGGAAMGVLAPLLAFSPTLVVVNRQIEKANRILKNTPQVKALTYETLPDSMDVAFDYIINATSTSLSNSIPPIPASYVNNACCIDLAYHLKEPTMFLQWAMTHYASKTIDGLGMLVEQAALGFSLWHGKMPDTKAVIAGLR